MRSNAIVSVGPYSPDHSWKATPSFAFNPSDPWTLTFQVGLEHAQLSGRRVYEVGVGSGTNAAFMLRYCAAALVLGSDLDPRLPVLAQRFVAEVAPELRDRFRPIRGSVNLIDRPEVTDADVVVGCLPQVPDPEDEMYTRFCRAQLNTVRAAEHRDDHIAHYYPWATFQHYPFNSVGLGLIEALLRMVRSYAPHAEVVLNLGCRIGKDILRKLFESNGYQPEELASRIVRQDQGTDISFFVALEATVRGTRYEKNFECEFYADANGRRRISATKAMERMDADPARPVFHEICVLRGHPEKRGG
jgi:methylase of polypeptide subunit release factors